MEKFDDAHEKLLDGDRDDNEDKADKLTTWISALSNFGIQYNFQVREDREPTHLEYYQIMKTHPFVQSGYCDRTYFYGQHQ